MSAPVTDPTSRTYFEEHVWIGGAWRLHGAGHVSLSRMWQLALDAEERGAIVLADTN